MRLAAGLVLTGLLLILADIVSMSGAGFTTAGVIVIVAGAVVGATVLEPRDALSPLAARVDETNRARARRP